MRVVDTFKSCCGNAHIPSCKKTACHFPDFYRHNSLLRHVESLGTCDDSSWKQTYPLREDINLHKLSVMSEAHNSIDFDKQVQLDSYEEVCDVSLMSSDLINMR